MHELEALFHRAADAADAAILPYFRAFFDTNNKAGEGAFDPVTDADRKAEKAIRAVIADTCPDDGILGEEFGEQIGTSGRRWIIDPIDGTRAFICGIPLFGTILGLVRDNQALAGLFSQPYTKERFFGDGQTTWFQREGTRKPLTTRPTARLDEALMMSTSPKLFAAEELPRYQAMEDHVRLTRYGADAYGYALLAAGQIDLVVEAGLHIYDIAGLIPIIEGAGGIVTDWSGGNPTNGGRILAAANPVLHDKALAVLNP